MTDYPIEGILPALAEEQAVEAAKRKAMSIRAEPGIPVRVLVRDGRVVWSKVDDAMVDLTEHNSDGLLYHIRSLFVPHGKPNPLLLTPPADSAMVEALAAVSNVAHYLRVNDTDGRSDDDALEIPLRDLRAIAVIAEAMAAQAAKLDEQAKQIEALREALNDITVEPQIVTDVDECDRRDATPLELLKRAQRIARAALDASAIRAGNGGEG